MEGIIKPELISLRLKQQLIIPSPSSHIILLFSLFCPISPFLSSPLPLADPPPSPPVRPFLPPSPPIHSCCLGNNTKRFSSQLCHRGNAWLSSRLLLEARRPPVRSSRLVLTTVRSRLPIGWKLLERWRLCGALEETQTLEDGVSAAVEVMEILCGDCIKTSTWGLLQVVMVIIKVSGQECSVFTNSTTKHFKLATTLIYTFGFFSIVMVAGLMGRNFWKKHDLSMI